ncbi:hypothetical protein PMAA_099570 [Talaromyces marneffei ATCC 18224]|uniref:Uncharacterized protein n=1 Tax=Talaromyces marneffei (strain ATCC 18224 / CBS 334.59 / QM 7333) TaxID=441960 RepID=B6QJ24_TALMQ|nr:hypothetical protein PMAA_099570 [Talaromyces marneffei ATCC 18224]
MQSTSASSIKTASSHQNVSRPQQLHRYEQQSIPESTHHNSFDRALRTRDICALAILLGWLVAICSVGIGIQMILSWTPIDPCFIGKKVLLGTGVFCFRPKYPLNMNVWGHKAYAMPKYVSNLITLSLRTTATGLIDYGHLSANVDFKRTPILNFLQAQNHISQISDILSLCGQVTQPATSIEKEIIDFNGWGVMAFGAGLLLHCLESPILPAPDTSHTTLNPRSSKEALPFVQPLTASTPDILPSRPQRQQSMLAILPRACRIRYIVWAFFGAFAIWSGISGIAGSATGQLKPRDAIVNGTNSSWESFAIVEVMYPSAAHFIYRHDWIGLLIQIVTQSFIVLGLHCIELITNISRDESCWRKAAAVGVEMKGSATTTFTTSWQSMTCKILKSITQWVFGKAFTADISVIMSLFLLVTMTDLFLLSYIFTEYLIRRKPKGYQPVTYGDICRLARYIDEWDETRIFWGDKGEIGNGTRRAGTAGHRLCDIQPDTLYIGLA